MLWKLCHKLFGWDYIQWSNSADQGIARVYVSYDGIVYYWRYKVTKVIDKIERSEQVFWLTCSSEKYFPLVK